MSLSQPTISQVLQDLMFEIDIETIQGKTADFIKSVNKHFKEKGFVTPAQEKPIRDIAEKHFR